MFGRTAKSWFYNCAKSTKREKENRNKWLSEIPSNQREKILEELDVNKVLSYLVYKRVFSLEEYKDIWSQESCKKRTEYFLDKLSLKGPSAFSAFCSVLEEVCPNLLTSFLLGYEDHLHRRFAALPEQTKLRAVSEMELHEACQMSDQEGSPSAEEQLIQPFNKYRLKSSMS
ncbi:hypothetical protein AV530_019386 [Patagioenas fasciata monilis]|uniref:CARD domain-containing protein n=1 Tax=Patagioenas fasciata monilis TaxID=372326 RepID=A0A1V4JDN5_PATFA|nr:hypothetical protein AV530_019386 [Patagioenas fasciata monilis]